MIGVKSLLQDGDIFVNYKDCFMDRDFGWTIGLIYNTMSDHLETICLGLAHVLKLSCCNLSFHYSTVPFP